MAAAVLGEKVIPSLKRAVAPSNLRAKAAANYLTASSISPEGGK
jgi:hypothetical protein